jgi:hypothetical protein
MADYSDTAERVFRQTLEDLNGHIPPDLLLKLRALLAAGSLHNPERLQAVIRANLGGKTAKAP